MTGSGICESWPGRGDCNSCTQRHLACGRVRHTAVRVWVLLEPSGACKLESGAWPGICSGCALGILISSILKVAITKERPSGGTKATKQPYKLNRTVLVAISLPWVVNHSVCRREVYVVCAQSATTSKPWEGTEGGGREGVVPFQWLMVNLKGPGL